MAHKASHKACTKPRTKLHKAGPHKACTNPHCTAPRYYVPNRWPAGVGRFGTVPEPLA